MINIVSETLKLVIFNGKCNILLQLSVKIHPNLYYWIKMQRKPFTANLIMVPSWHFGVSSTFFQVSSGRNGRKWKKPPFFQFLPNVRKKPISSGRNPTLAYSIGLQRTQRGQDGRWLYTKIKVVALTCIKPLGFGTYAKSHNSFITVVGWTLFLNLAPGRRTYKWAV